MTIIDQAKAFVNRLRCPAHPAICRHCGYRYTKRNGTYTITVRDLGGVRQDVRQRWWCHRCRKTYTPDDPQRARYQRYTRRVQRKALDLRVHLGGSLRRTAEWLRAEVSPGSGRSRIWDPRQPDAVPAPPQAKLHHTTLWRWQRGVSHRWRQRQQQAAVWSGIHWPGHLVSDATGILIRGVPTSLHLIAVAGSGVVLRLQHLVAETRTALRWEFQQALAALGVRWQTWTDLMSDGAAVYADLLRWDAPQVTAHRWLFHLWRNVGPRLRQYATAQGEAHAEALRTALHRVWDAADVSTAQTALRQLAQDWSTDLWVQEVVIWIASTLPAVMAPRTVPGMPRTTNDAELRFERYKRRYRMLHSGFMSATGAQSWHDLWQVYANWEPPQIRKERKRWYHHPLGPPLLERGGLDLAGTTWLDALEI